MTFTLLTLGCKVNQAESGGIASLLRSRGHRLAEPGETPHMVLINTCTVTAAADHKSRNAIRRAAKLYPGAAIGVCGCLSQTEVLDVDGVCLYGGSGDKSGFALALETAALSRRGEAAAQSLSRDFPEAFDELPDAPAAGRTRMFLKIQDGCENHCAYCRIPAARGPCRSRSLESALAAAKDAARRGVPELVLTGIEITSYKPGLAALTRNLCQAVPDMRVRLGSLYPCLVDDVFCAALGDLPNLCPHFHLSLQSGCDQTLGRMGRRYNVQNIREVFHRLRQVWERPALSCDILCGFPGESGDDHRKTMELLQELRPARLHVFAYSPRKGTAAASMSGKIPRSVKQQRSAELRALDAELRQEYAQSWLGTVQDVLFESEDKGLWSGLTSRYVAVRMASPEDLRGKIQPVRLTQAVLGGMASPEDAGSDENGGGYP